MTTNLSANIPLLGFVCNALLALLVYAGGPRQPLNQVYALLGLSIAGWNLGQYHLFLVNTRYEALFWLHFEWVPIIMGPVLLFHLSLMVAELRTKRWHLALPYSVCSFFVLLLPTGLVISGARHLGASGWYAEPGIGLYLFHPVFTSLVVLSIIILSRRRASVPKLHRKKLDALIAAQGLLLFSGLNDVLPIMGYETYPFTDVVVFPYGSVAAVFYGIIVGYSVLQNELLDVQVKLSRVAAQIVRFLFFLVIGASLLLLSSLVFRGEFTSFAFLLSLLVLVATGLVSSFLFPKLFGTGSENIERRLLGDRFEYHDRVRSFIQSLRSYESREEMLPDLSRLITSTMGVGGYRLYFYDTNRENYELVDGSSDGSPEKIPHEDGPQTAKFFEMSKVRNFLIEMVWSGPGITEMRSLRRTMLAMNMQVCLPLFAEGHHFGMLLLGRKNGNAPYTSTDIVLLESLVENLSLVLNQFRLTEQIVQVQEAELLGRMSKGIAHDMNNLLTPISTLLQLLDEGLSPEELRALVPSAKRNIETARSYILNSLFISNQKSGNFKENDLYETIQFAREAVRHELERNETNLVVRSPRPLRAVFDMPMMIRVFTNLVSNAIDASLPGSPIEIECGRVRTPRSNAEWIEVSVRDHGTGIPEDVLGSIGQAYFTTKDTGDEKRGFGLGIAICKKVIQLHGGVFRIESKVGVGTKITFDIPANLIQDEGSRSRRDLENQETRS